MKVKKDKNGKEYLELETEQEIADHIGIGDEVSYHDAFAEEYVKEDEESSNKEGK